MWSEARSKSRRDNKMTFFYIFTRSLLFLLFCCFGGVLYSGFAWSGGGEGGGGDGGSFGGGGDGGSGGGGGDFDYCCYLYGFLAFLYVFLDGNVSFFYIFCFVDFHVFSDYFLSVRYIIYFLYLFFVTYKN